MCIKFYALLLMVVISGPVVAGEGDIIGYSIGDPESGMPKADKLYEKDGAVYYRAPRKKGGGHRLEGVPAENAQLVFKSGRLIRIELTTAEIQPGKGQYCIETAQVAEIEKALAGRFGKPVLQARLYSGPESFRMLADEYGACRALRDDVYDCEIALFEKWPAKGDSRQHALEVVMNSAILGKQQPDDGDQACLVRVIYRQGEHVDKKPDPSAAEDLLWDLMGE